MKTAPRILLTKEERSTLNLWVRLSGSARLALRAKILLLAADGRLNKEIARQLQASTKTVSMWRRRFQTGRLAALKRPPREANRSRRFTDRCSSGYFRKHSMSVPIMRALDDTIVSQRTWRFASLVQRVWKANGLTTCQQ